MVHVRLFRNDGNQMFVDDSETLDYIDPGIVLLYADTRQRLVCSYLEGHLGQRIQATVECQFDGQIDLTEVPNALSWEGITNLSLSDPPANDLSSPRWALHGLLEESLSIGETQRAAIRRLLSTERIDSESEEQTPHFHDGLFWAGTSAAVASHDETLDLAVGHPYDGARLFKHFVQELADMDVTIAVSKSGRVAALEDTDIVIHIDPARVSREQPVVPINGSQKLINEEKGRQQREKISEQLSDPLDEISHVVLSEPARGKEITDPLVKTALREELNESVLSSVGLEVVNRRQNRVRTSILALSAALVGTVFGIGISDTAIRTAETLAEQGRTAVLAAFDQLRRVLPSVTLSGASQLYASVALISVSVLVGALVLRRRYTMDTNRNLAPTSTRSDAVALSLNVATAVSLFGLLTSILLLWTVG